MSDSKGFLFIIIGVVAIFGVMAFLFMGGLNSNSGVQGTPLPTNYGAVSALMKDGYQEIELKALSTGEYDKPVIEVKAGVPVRLKFTAEQYAGCGRQLVIPDFGVQTVVAPGQSEVLEFTPTTPGTYAYRCGMNMFRGKLIVK